MKKIKAKPIVDNEFWVLHNQKNKKIGQIKVTNKNIEVRISGDTINYDSLDDLKNSGIFEFIKIKNTSSDGVNEVHGFKTDALAYNTVWNVEYQLPLYTKSKKSKSQFAAGYYKVYINDSEVTYFCPKFITLQRNKFEGPFKTKPGSNLFDDFFEEHK